MTKQSYRYGFGGYQKMIDTVQPDDIILFMFSGGLDGTVVLYYLLKEANCNIHIHHVHIRNVERRAMIEQRVVSDILQYFKEKKFGYSDTIYHTEFKHYYSYDIDVVAFHAAQVCYNLENIKYVVIGVQADDAIPFNQSVQNRAKQASAIFNVATTNHPNDIQLIGGYDKFNKQSVLEIPEDLRMLTWSCRTPVWLADEKFQRCGKCKTCNDLKNKGLWDVTPDTR